MKILSYAVQEVQLDTGLSQPMGEPPSYFYGAGTARVRLTIETGHRYTHEAIEVKLTPDERQKAEALFREINERLSKEES